MAKKTFRIAFSTIAVTPFINFIRLVTRYPISRKYLGRCFLAGLISMIAEPFRLVEQLLYARKLHRTRLPASPVFILGHWRSGTTLLHNLMCKDQQFAYITTYQGVFVNQFFASRWLFRPLMKWLMPEKRPSDNVLLSPDFPQEEGFALCNMHSYAFYNFWYFPRQWKHFYDRYVSCRDLTAKQKRQYSKRYKKLIAQSLLEHQKENFISKNPVNTGSIQMILEMFPDARFIYLYRNPVMVFHSTFKFFTAVMETLRLQVFTPPEMEELIFELYERLISEYEKQKALIPPHHLIEIRYEDFLQHPEEHLKQIYTSLNLPGFDRALPHFMTYLDTQKSFEKNKHLSDPLHLEKVKTRWGFAMKKYGYAEAATGAKESSSTHQLQ
ncbi:MAG: sulfotransferase [Chitinophagales bacterium]|nr:sulfotransferase [Chitinophagales bacterium]